MSDEVFARAKTDHIFVMTDDTGLLQHATYSVPCLQHGYSSDDNARGLIMAVMLYQQNPSAQVERLIYRYLAFLCHARNENGTFRNFLDYSRKFVEIIGSEDTFGRCLWGLSFALSQSLLPTNMREAIRSCLKPSIPFCTKLNSPRSIAYSILGLRYLESESAQKMLIFQADALVTQYDKYKDGDWHWFENSFAYSNSVLPHALLAAYQKVPNLRYLHVAKESLDFLETKTFREEYYKPIGCNGWLEKNGAQAEYDEQPVEAGETTLAYLDAFVITGEKRYFELASRAFAWFYGRNSQSLHMIDPDTGGCYDGICAHGLNRNEGAESLVSYWIAYLSMLKYL
jgi:hypothetical protein